jgi:hypothetical protein
MIFNKVNMNTIPNLIISHDLHDCYRGRKFFINNLVYSRYKIIIKFYLI